MGFKSGSYCTVWRVIPATDTRTNVRITISRKNKKTNEYETEFSGFVEFIGTIAAKQALSLKEKDRIRLGDVDVTNFYSKEKDITYTNYKVFNFELVNGGTHNNSPTPSSVDELGDGDSGDLDDSLPW